MQKQPYKAYLIRCWRVDPNEHPSRKEWRFSLESVDSESDKRKQAFTDPKDLLEYLTNETGIEPGLA